MIDADTQYRQSTLRERIVEHVFIGDALRSLWRRGITDVEVLRSEFDAHGYDLVMARGPVVRHIQFKTGTSKPGNVSVASALADKPAGCAIFIQITPLLDMGPYFWFGGGPDEPLPPIAGFRNPLRPTRNKEGVRPVRQNHREVPAAAFARLDTLDAVLERLFGPLRPEAPA